MDKKFNFWLFTDLLLFINIVVKVAQKTTTECKKMLTKIQKIVDLYWYRTEFYVVFGMTKTFLKGRFYEKENF